MTSSTISAVNDNERMDPTHPRADGPRRRCTKMPQISNPPLQGPPSRRLVHAARCGRLVVGVIEFRLDLCDDGVDPFPIGLDRLRCICSRVLEGFVHSRRDGVGAEP